MFHLFGNILTNYAPAANNRAESEGNIAQLQKIIWKSETHTAVSAEAIRWALRYYWQQSGFAVNRQWNEERHDYFFNNPDYDAEAYIDDDVLGFMRAEAAKIDNSDQLQQSSRSRKKPAKGTILARRGALEVDRAVSTIPFFGETVFSGRSGAKGRNSLYSTEVHATRYQYGFALTPDHLNRKARTLAVLDGLSSLSNVGGNHARFLYDFSPESIILRWTHDFAPRFLYCFHEDARTNISVPTLINRISCGDVDPNEVWVGGLASEALSEWGVHTFPGIKAAVDALKDVLARDLQISL